MNCDLCREIRKHRLIDDLQVICTTKRHLDVIKELASEVNGVYASIETMMDEVYRTKKETRLVTKMMAEFCERVNDFLDAYYAENEDGDFYLSRLEYCGAVHKINIVTKMASKIGKDEYIEDLDLDDE